MARDSASNKGGNARQDLAFDGFLRAKTVQQLLGISRTTLWRLCRGGKFPARRKLSTNSVGWLKSEIAQWAESRTIVGGTAHG